MNILKSLGFALLVLFLGSQARSESNPYLVGMAKAVVTPSQAEISGGKIKMGGYAPLRTATGVHDDLYARVWAVSDGAETLVFSVLDLPGISNISIRHIRELVKAAIGLAEDHVYVGATHTHSGADLQGLWGGVSPSYAKVLEETTSATIVAAVKGMKPATLNIATGHHQNRNRRDWPMSDQDLTVIDVKAIDTGERIGTVVNFAAHPVFDDAKNTKLSRDFCGHVVDSLEAGRGGVAVFFNGIVGDVTPGWDVPGSLGAESFGKSIAQAAESALASQEPLAAGAIHTTSTIWAQEVKNTFFEVARTLGMLRYDIDNSDGKLKINVRTGYFRIGQQLQGAIFPGESLTRLGLPIKEKMTSKYRMFLGLMGDTLGYFVPSDEWKTGHNKNYEESVSLYPTVGDKAQAALFNLIAKD